MAISISGRVVKCRPKSELKRVDNKRNMRQLVAKYNHLRIQFADGAERHFLFTDKQMRKGVEDATKILKEYPKVTWVKELWYEGLMDIKLSEIRKHIADNHLPSFARQVNHIRVSIGERDIHLLLSDGAVRSALSRAKKVEGTLPKVSWLSDEFEDNTSWDKVEKQGPELAPRLDELQTIGS